MTIQAYLKKEQPLKNGNLRIIFKVGSIRVVSGESIKLNQWKLDKQTADPRYTGSEGINKRLTTKKAVLQRIIESVAGQEQKEISKRFKAYLKNPEKLDAIVNNATDPTGALSFHYIIDNILRENQSLWTEKYQLKFKTIRKKILEYDPDFNVKGITVSWWKEFANHCAASKGDGGLNNSQNTISTDAKILKRIIEILRDRGYQFASGLNDIGVQYTEPEIMSLEWDQVKAIADLDLSDALRGTMSDSRTLWLIGAYTGRRWNEVIRMTPENFYKTPAGQWKYKGIGKGNKRLDIPLLDEAISLLKKIKFTPPVLAPQTVNLDVKDLARMAGINKPVMTSDIRQGKNVEKTVPEYKTVHFHTGRHSYAMHIVDLYAGRPNADKHISALMGHTSHATTWKYLNLRAGAVDKVFEEVVNEKASK